MLPQRLATGANGVKQARYNIQAKGAARHSYAHAQYIHNASMYVLLNVRPMNSAEGFAL